MAWPSGHTNGTHSIRRKRVRNLNWSQRISHPTPLSVFFYTTSSILIDFVEEVQYGVAQVDTLGGRVEGGRVPR